MLNRPSQPLRALARRGALALALVLLAGSPAAAAVPRGFFGIHAWTTPPEADFARMSLANAGTYRTNFFWYDVEPRPGRRDWEPYDEIVARATRARMAVLPVILGSPSFAASITRDPPRPRALHRYRAFVRDLVARYGPGTAFFRNRSLPERPITAWQVWNEPNLRFFWRDRPSAREYAALLRLTAREIKSVDADARVIMAGLPEGIERNGNVSSARYLDSIYRVAGAAADFDVVALHPYAPDDLGIHRLIRRVREVMRRHGDARTELWITETGFASGGPRSAYTSSESGQAERMRRTFAMILRNRARFRIGRVVWFSLRDRRLRPRERDFWTFRTGLFRRSGSPKPAWRLFARYAGGDPGHGPLGSGDQFPKELPADGSTAFPSG